MQPGVLVFECIYIIFELAILGVDRFDVRVDVGLSPATKQRDNECGCERAVNLQSTLQRAPFFGGSSYCSARIEQGNRPALPPCNEELLHQKHCLLAERAGLRPKVETPAVRDVTIPGISAKGNGLLARTTAKLEIAALHIWNARPASRRKLFAAGGGRFGLCQ